jgi:hypothetical protein
VRKLGILKSYRKSAFNLVSKGEKLPNLRQGSLAAIFCAAAFRMSGEGLCSLTAIRRK